MTNRSSRSAKSKAKATNKKRTTQKRTSRTTTVESLQASFEKIDGKVRDMIARGKSNTDIACCIRKAWNEQFHMKLSEPAVKGMIVHYRAVAKRSTVAKRSSQRGGMAPMDWTMGQGTISYTHGEFPAEIASSPQVVKALDRFVESRVGRACDATGGHAAQRGAGILQAIANGHAPASVPSNPLSNGINALQGVRSIEQEASPVTYSAQLATFTPKPFDVSSVSSVSSMAPVYVPRA